MLLLHIFAMCAFIATAQGWGVKICIGWCSGKRDLRRHNNDCDVEANTVCARTCKAAADGLDCHFSCASRCRGHTENELTEGHLVPLPLDFNFYDCLSQGRFTAECLAANFGDDIEDRELQKTFDVADGDKDGYVTPDELKAAHWIFEGREKKMADDTGDVVDPPEELKKDVRKMEDTETKNPDGERESDTARTLRVLRTLLNKKGY